MPILSYICGAILIYICAWLIFDWLTFNIAQGPGVRPFLLERRWARNLGIGIVLLLLFGSAFLFYQINTYLFIVPIVIFGLQVLIDRYRRNRKINNAANCILSKYFSEIEKGTSNSEACKETCKHFTFETPEECSLNDLVFFYLVSKKIVPVSVASKMSQEIEDLISLYRQSSS